jgi:hypothetical protein
LTSSKPLLHCMILSMAIFVVLISPFPTVAAQVPFTLVVTPGHLVLGIVTSTAGRFGVSVLAGQAFNGTVALGVAGVPTGVQASFEEAAVSLLPLEVSTTYLDVAASPNATLGSYSLTISATSQQPSIFYASSSQATLVIRENGEPGLSSTGNSATAEREVPIPWILIGLVVAFALGSATTYLLTRKKRKPAKRLRRVATD